MIAYNHAPFVRQAVESALMQKTDFAVEIVIGEDCSTDETRNICRELAAAHPERIRLLLPPANLGMNANARQTVAACRGQYVAILEGDDYWTHPGKLAAQVASLDADESLSASCHAVDLLIDATQELRDAQPVGYLSRFDLLPQNWSVLDWPRARPATGSLLVRTSVMKTLLGEDLESVLFCDAVILFGAHKVGDIRYLPDVWGVYRAHAGGMWSGATKAEHYEATLSTVRSLIQHRLYRDETVYGWLKQLFDFNVIKLAGLAPSLDVLQQTVGIDWERSLDDYSANAWGLRTACIDLLDANRAVADLRASTSFRLGNRVVRSANWLRQLCGLK